MSEQDAPSHATIMIAIVRLEEKVERLEDESHSQTEKLDEITRRLNALDIADARRVGAVMGIWKVLGVVSAAFFGLASAIYGVVTFIIDILRAPPQ